MLSQTVSLSTSALVWGRTEANHTFKKIKTGYDQDCGFFFLRAELLCLFYTSRPEEHQHMRSE